MRLVHVLQGYDVAERRRRATCLAERRSMCWRSADCDTRCLAAVRYLGNERAASIV
ncbi:MAG: hypothetical protein ACLP0J_02440 [Solirubrobacteraceae bacterium]